MPCGYVGDPATTRRRFTPRRHTCGHLPLGGAGRGPTVSIRPCDPLRRARCTPSPRVLSAPPVLRSLPLYAYPLRTILVYDFTLGPGAHGLLIERQEEMWSFADMIAGAFFRLSCLLTRGRVRP